MPTYEYQCLSCRQHFERKQSFTDEPVKVCPSCGGEVRKVLHPPGIVFKGSGWYVTDSRKSTESSEGAASSAAPAAGSSPDGATASGDSKAGTATSSGASGGSSRAGASGSSGGSDGGSSPGKSGRDKAS